MQDSPCLQFFLSASLRARSLVWVLFHRARTNEPARRLSQYKNVLLWVPSVLYISSLRHVSANVMLRVTDYLSPSSYLFIVLPFRSKFSSNNIRRTNWGQYNCRRNSYYNCYSWGSKQRFLDFHFIWDTSRGLYDDKRCVVSNFGLDGHF